jgi:hypothetical protein
MLAGAFTLACLVGCQGTIRDEGASDLPQGGAADSGSGGKSGSFSGGSGGQSPPASGGGPSGGTIAPASPQFSCDSAATPDELPLPRLSRNQLANTLRFAIARALPMEADAIWKKVSETFDQYPIDRRVPAPGDLKGGYGRADQSIQQSQVDVMYSVGLSMARELTATAARLARLMGDCASDASTTNDRACLEAFVRGWGSRVLRYAMPDADVAYFADIAGTTPIDPSAVADVIATLVNSPQFLYRVEHGTAKTEAVSPLSAHELAARLSYQFYQAPPDDVLWQAAETGELLTAQGFDAQLTRLLAGPELASSLDEFVSDWLRLEELPSLEALRADPVFASFAGTPLPTDVTRAAMLDDTRLSLRETLARAGSIADFWSDRHSYTNDEYLAAIYGVAPWSGKGSPPSFPSENRAGLLGRAALLATGTAATRPIHKGYLIRNALLCEQVGSPPANAASIPPTPTATKTTRQAVSELTSGGSCGGCHNVAINPLGFVLEGFDALGRERSQEPLFDASGQLTTAPPIDTSTTVVINGDSFSLSSPAELTRRISDSKLFESCWVRHYFRFSKSRVEDGKKDGCLLSALETTARSGKPIAEVLKVMANDKTFQARRFQ